MKIDTGHRRHDWVRWYHGDPYDRVPTQTLPTVEATPEVGFHTFAKQSTERRDADVAKPDWTDWL